MKLALVACLSLIALCAPLSGCNRAMVRIPGASTDFPDTDPGFRAAQPIAATIEIATPVDMRSSHYEDSVAGTRWQGCDTDAMWSKTAPSFLEERLSRAFANSGLFIPSATTPNAPHLVLHAEIDAFCSKVVGLVIMRGAGIVAIKFSLTRDGHVVWERKLERVVTDADPEYTGSQVTFIEQAMRVTMTDSLRLVLRDLLQNIDQNRSALLAAT